MTDERPNPDELLARMHAEEIIARRGKLKIFFGYAAGVGKTFAMLEAAQRERAAGVDVVVGYVEPHGRPETEALLRGLEDIPPKAVPYRGVSLNEFDLDAALARHPQLILVDELAHTNAEGLRHAKRWQDVEELLEAGINVFSTLNVQHIESLNDVIAQITAVVVRETLPDAVLERADDIELIDLTPEELIERLKEGKVYLPQQAERALQHFFSKSNLQALRELSLRQAAHRLQRDVEASRQAKAVVQPWATDERLLVCISASPTTAKVIRTAKRMATAFGADWLAVAVQTNKATEAVNQQLIAEKLRLAEQLGAEPHMIVGDKIADTVLEYARSRNVTKIVVGKTAQPWWRRWLRRTVVDELLERSGEIDIYVIRGEDERPRPRAMQPPPAIAWPAYLGTAAVVALCGLVGSLLHNQGYSEANIIMTFLLGEAFVATRFGSGPAVACAIAGVLTFDFFFVPPYWSFSVDDTKYFVTFSVMLTIGLIISTLTTRSRAQLIASQLQERRTAALYRLTKQLSEVAGTEFLINAAGRQLSEIFEGEAVLFLREGNEPLTLRFGVTTSIAKESINAIVAQWVADHDRTAGAGTDTLPNATALFVPLIGSRQTVGALGIKPAEAQRLRDPEQRRLLETCASLTALSIERDQSLLQAHQAQLQVQGEQLRNSLLRSVSHDLRTPLAAIAGASSSLLEAPAKYDDATRRELLQSIVDESHRLARLVDNLLDMTRLESGTVALNKQWHVLEEIVGSALARLRQELAHHEVHVAIPSDLPLLSIDGMLIEQVFFNLLENASRYTPAGSRIEIGVRQEAKAVEVRIADNGPGLPPGSEARVFEKFYRGSTTTADGSRGAGLGLTICLAIIQLHGGHMSARNRPEGGVEFMFALPCEKAPPHVVLDDLAAAASSP